MLSLLKLTQSRKCKILQCDEYQIVKIHFLINPTHSCRTQMVIGSFVSIVKNQILICIFSYEISLTCRLPSAQEAKNRVTQVTRPFPCLFNWSDTPMSSLYVCKHKSSKIMDHHHLDFFLIRESLLQLINWLKNISGYPSTRDPPDILFHKSTIKRLTNVQTKLHTSINFFFKKSDLPNPVPKGSKKK